MSAEEAAAFGRWERKVASIAAGQYGLITLEQALQSGATPDQIKYRVKSGRWLRLHRGVYVIAGSAQTWEQAALGACFAAGQTAALSYRSAARLWKFPGFEDVVAIDLSIPRTRRVQLSGVTIHQTIGFDDQHHTRLGLFPVTAPSETLLDLAAICSKSRLEEIFDDALRRNLVSVSRVKWTLQQKGGHGRKGSANLRRLTEARSPNSAVPQSVLESRFYALIKKLRLPRPECQYRVVENGRTLAVVDFAYPDLRIAIEIDGYRWHSGRQRWERDLARRNALTSRGWRVLHFTAQDLKHNPLAVIEAIRAALDLPARNESKYRP